MPKHTEKITVSTKKAKWDDSAYVWSVTLTQQNKTMRFLFNGGLLDRRPSTKEIFEYINFCLAGYKNTNSFKEWETTYQNSMTTAPLIWYEEEYERNNNIANQIHQFFGDSEITSLTSE